jgi:flagellar hook-associated protein 2
MAGSLALSGLASGVDTSGIVQQLMAIESQGRNRIVTKQGQVTAQQTALKDIASKLSALKTAAASLTDSATWTSSQTVDSSDSTRVAATLISGTAGAGGVTVNVTKLAAAAQHGFDYDPAAGATIRMMRNGSQVGSPIILTPNTSITDAAARINSANLDMSATVVTDNGVQSLVLASKSTGDASAFTIDGLTASANTRWERAGNDAEYTVGDDPTVRKSASNTVDNAIPGVKLAFKSTTSSPVTINIGSPGLDQDKVKGEVQDFVNAYNALITAVNAKTTEKRDPKATSTTDLNKGTLFGDTGLTSMISHLRSLSAVNDPLTAFDGIAELGITTGKPGVATDDSKLGKLTIDTDKLSDLLTGDPANVKKLLGDFSKKISAYVDGQSKVLDGRVSSDDSQLKSLTDELKRTDDALDLKQQRLQAQFAAMETALSQAQSQQSWLQGQIASLG